MYQNDFLEDMFQLREIEKIGEGNFGIVYKALDLLDNTICAVKVVQKQMVKDFAIEIDIFQNLQHEYIVKFKRVMKFICENKHNYYLVMELMSGGTLSDAFRVGMSEELASQVMKNILSAVNYIHDNQIVHRDLKPENILLQNEDITTCKIADFGLSFKFSKDGNFHKLLQQKCGTMMYMAPEQFRDKYYNKQVDSWSCGILMYMLLSGGVHPLYEKIDTKDRLTKKIMNPEWKFPDTFSKLAIDLFLKLTKQTPQDRYSAGQALLHPWITRNLNDQIPKTFQERMNQFQKTEQIYQQFRLLFFVQFIIRHSDKVYRQDEEREEKPPQKSIFHIKQRVLSPRTDIQSRTIDTSQLSRRGKNSHERTVQSDDTNPPSLRHYAQKTSTRSFNKTADQNIPFRSRKQLKLYQLPPIQSRKK